MGLESVNSVISRVSVLREVDSVVDLTRGWLQLRIVIVLGFYGRSDADELAKVLGERKKAILDALRKLKMKGLVVDADSGRYVVLSDEGRKLYETLVGIISSAVSGRNSEGALPLIEDVHRDLTTSFYLYEVIIALGTSRKYELPLDTLASIVKLSPEVLDDYLKPYADGSLKLFKRYVVGSKMSLRRGRKVVYRLSDDGLKVYRRLPDYMKYRSDWKALILRYITRSGHPKIVLKRISLMLSLGSAAVALITTLLPVGLSLLVIMSWVLVISFIALLTELTY